MLSFKFIVMESKQEV